MKAGVKTCIHTCFCIGETIYVKKCPLSSLSQLLWSSFTSHFSSIFWLPKCECSADCFLKTMAVLPISSLENTCLGAVFVRETALFSEALFKRGFCNC